MIRVDEEHIADMMNILSKLEEAKLNAPSAIAPDVVRAVEDFMQRLTYADCELFARDIRRKMDNVIESKSN